MTIDDPCRRANLDRRWKTAMVKWAIAAILLLPATEIAFFALLAAMIGWTWTITLMFATTLAGVWVLRQAGRGWFARFRVAVADSDAAWIEANNANSLTVLAGVLLFLPGFLTDLAGVVLLVGPLRRSCGRTIRSWVRSRNRSHPAVIDLAPGEWRQVPDPELQKKSRKRKRR